MAVIVVLPLVQPNIRWWLDAAHFNETPKTDIEWIKARHYGWRRDFTVPKLLGLDECIGTTSVYANNALPKSAAMLIGF